MGEAEIVSGFAENWVDIKSSWSSGEENVISLASLLSGVGHHFQLLTLSSLGDLQTHTC